MAKCEHSALEGCSCKWRVLTRPYTFKQYLTDARRENLVRRLRDRQRLLVALQTELDRVVDEGLVEDLNQVRVWHGKRTCDGCDRALAIDVGASLYDARTFGGQWGTFCRDCWQQYTPMELGVGHGQRYVLQADGRFVKAEG